MAKPSEIDQLHDPSFKTFARRLREVPEFVGLVKTASVDAEEAANLPNSAFAWEERRLYPIHTPEQAALSYMYATDKLAHVPDSVLESLKNALQVYGVDLPSTQKEASAPPDNEGDYLIPELKRWRVVDANTVKLAAQAITEYGSALSAERQVAVASRLLEKAAQHGVDLGPDIAALAGNVVSDLPTVRDWLEVRASIAPKDVVDGYEKVAEHLNSVTELSSDRESLIKLASTIETLDKASGLSAHYGSKLPTPVQTVFNTHKLASASVDLGGKSVSIAKLAAVPLHVYEDVFGDDITPEITTDNSIDISKVATVIGTMPLDLKKIFAKQIGA